ncbi:MAG: LysR substrate-binding domain-containing protein [Paracoccaceae bacterium]
MTISLKQLTYFVALAEERSFGIAAARVHVSQPALSQQIKALELLLGAPLVERLPRDIRLTRAGQATLERARRVLAEVRDIEGSVRLQQGLAGRLMLGVIPTIAPYLLPLALTRIRARDLTLELRVREAQTATLMQDLADGQIDAAVISLPVSQVRIEAEPLFTDQFLLAGSQDRLATWRARAEHFRPEDVPQDQLLLLDEGHCLADQALEVCGLNRRRHVDLGASSLGTLAGLVAEGFGLTFLPEIAVRAEEGANTLALARFTAPEPGRTIALVRRTSSAPDAWFPELAQILREAGQELLAHARAQVPPANRAA